MSDIQIQQNQISENIPSSQKKKFFNFKFKGTTLYLENKGSIARDHLANERTFLAWLRTSLSFSGIGIALSQLFRLNISDGTIFLSVGKITGKILSLAFIALGMVFLLM
ncbi:10073_t:CDS:2, partial [Ambispora leptoticha]